METSQPTLNPHKNSDHKIDRWLLGQGRAVGLLCSCGLEVWDGNRFIAGNQEEVLSRMKLHTKGLY